MCKHPLNNIDFSIDLQSIVTSLELQRQLIYLCLSITIIPIRNLFLEHLIDTLGYLA